MLGVNIYGLIREIQKDAAGTFREIAAAGFDEAELLIMPEKKQGTVPIAIAAEETVPQILDTAKQCGLSARSAHVLCTTEEKTAPAEAVTELILHLKQQYGLKNYVFSGMFTDAAGAKKWASYLRQIAEAVKPSDCRIIYVHLKDVVLLPQERIIKGSEHTPAGELMWCAVWGKGVIPVQAICQKMLADGYNGKFSIEYVHPADGSDLTAHIPQLNRFLQASQHWAAP